MTQALYVLGVSVLAALLVFLFIAAFVLIVLFCVAGVMLLQDWRKGVKP